MSMSNYEYLYVCRNCHCAWIEKRDWCLNCGSYRFVPLTSIEESKMLASGKKPIVIALDAISPDTECDNKEDAITKASKFAGNKDKEFVVFIPVAIVSPKKDVVVTPIIIEA